MALISTKLRNSAKGQTCTFQIPGICRYDPAYTVLCHIRDEWKGIGNKAADWSAAFGCDRCHAAIDHHDLPKVDEEFYMRRALQRTWAFWIERGLVVLPVDPSTAKRRPSKKANLPPRKIPPRQFRKKDKADAQ